MANNRYASGRSDTTTVSGIKLLHRRKPTTEWINLGNSALTWGEFGIDTTTGEVRGYLIGGSDGATCSWQQATPVGSISLTEEEGTPDSRKYVYGIEEDMDGNHCKGYKLLTGTLPTVTIDADTNTDAATFTVISSIYRDPNNPDKFLYKTTNVPKVTINEDSSSSGKKFVTGISGSHESGFTYTTADEKTINGESNYDNTSGMTFIQGVKFSDTETQHKAEFKTVTLQGGNNVSVSSVDSGAGIKIDVDVEGILSGVSGALSFAGTIDISDSSKVNLDSYNWKSGVSRKVIATTSGATNNVTSAAMKIHTTTKAGEFWANSATVKPGDLIVYVTDAMTDDPNDNQPHYCVIPSGDETDAEGTVKTVHAGDGLETESGNAITENGTIKHRVAQRKDGDYKVGLAPTDSGNAYSTANNASDAEAESETYTFVNYISLDKSAANNGSLGHVTDVRQTSVKILSEDSVRDIAQEESSTLSVGEANFINVIETPKAGNTPRNYDVQHSKISGSMSAIKDTSGTRNYLTGVTRDEYGHVTGYTYGTESVGDTWRPLTFAGTTFDSSTTGGTLNITGSGYTTIDVNGNNITFNTSVPTASASELGLVKVSNVTTSTAANVTGYSAVTLGAADTFTAPVNMDAANKLYVTAYEHYVNKDAALADDNYNFCAIKRDKYGHVIDVASIDVIDGNY